MTNIEKKFEDAKSLLLDARTDIFHWIQLAKKQRSELKNVDYLPCGPTEDGIEGSNSLIKRIDKSFSEWRVQDGKVS